MAVVLVVDDDRDTREAVARYLRQAGHSATIAPNGQEALAALCVETPDVVVLDYRMPHMDGVTFLEVIRCYLRWQTLPVILLTAFPDGPHVKRAKELNVRRTFMKSNYQLSDLLAEINSCASSRGSSPAA